MINNKDSNIAVSIFDAKDGRNSIDSAIDKIGPLAHFLSTSSSSSSSYSSSSLSSSSSSLTLPHHHQLMSNTVIPSIRGLTCRLCQLTFDTSAEQQAHFKSESHLLNLTGGKIAPSIASEKREGEDSDSEDRFIFVLLL